MIGHEPRPGFHGTVVLAQTGDVDWTLARTMSYRALDGTVVEVPRHAPTDGASVPRMCSWLVPRSGRYLPAAIVHDYSYRVLIPTAQLTYQRADRMLLEGMRLLGVDWLTRWAIFAAVRLAGLGRGRLGRRGWLADAPRVIPVALLVAPIAVPVSAVVLLGLLAWHALGWVVYVALLARGRAGRLVNPPRDLSRAG